MTLSVDATLTMARALRRDAPFLSWMAQPHLSLPVEVEIQAMNKLHMEGRTSLCHAPSLVHYPVMQSDLWRYIIDEGNHRTHEPKKWIFMKPLQPIHSSVTTRYKGVADTVKIGIRRRIRNSRRDSSFVQPCSIQQDTGRNIQSENRVGQSVIRWKFPISSSPPPHSW